MPLPGNGTLSLHGYSRIGDTATTEPKKGMIIRMSPETLDALQDNLQKPNIELQLEDNPVSSCIFRNVQPFVPTLL